MQTACCNENTDPLGLLSDRERSGFQTGYYNTMRKSQSKGKKLETKVLQEETRRMQQKLHDLKKQIQLQKSQRDQKSQTGSRWKQSATTAPLRGYANKVIEQQKTLFKKHGITPAMLATKRSTFTQAKTQTKTQPKAIIQLPTSPSEDPIVELPACSLESKFGKAIINIQKVEVQDSISKFLKSLGLSQYIELFEQNHIYDIELIAKDVLEEMGIPAGHRVKILKRIKQHMEQKNPITSAVSESKTQSEMDPFMGQKQPQSWEQQPQLNGLDQEQVQQEGGKLLEGSYDEEKNARQFKEALQAYRGVYKQIEQIALQTESIPSTPLTSQRPATAKYACFSCYKSFVNQPYYLNNRSFCSEVCFKKYQISTRQSCSKCNRSFNKFEGFPHKGVRYCSIQCSPEARKMQEYFIKWRLEDRQQGQS